MIVSPSPWVWALKALQNSMMLTPCWPSAGPTGGAGLALPAWICSLMRVRTFLAMGIERVAGAALNLLHLVVADLDRGLAAEDRDQHLELRRVVVDLGDLAGEVGERAGDDLHRLADVELSLGARPLGGLAVKQTVDLGLRERNRLVARADEPGDAGGVLDQAPGVVGHLH